MYGSVCNAIVTLPSAGAVNRHVNGTLAPVFSTVYVARDLLMDSLNTEILPFEILLLSALA